MTREEAIKILKDLSDCSYIGSLASEDFEALKMAIKALKQEPINNILDDIYTEIEDKYEDCVIGKLDDDEMSPCFRRTGSIDGVLDILDKHKVESEE